MLGSPRASTLPAFDPVTIAIIKKRYNFRDIATFACSVRPNLLYRSGILTNLQPSHKVFFKSLNLSTIVDLRSDRECAKRRASVPTGVNYVRLPIETEEIMKELINFSELFLYVRKTKDFSIFERRKYFMVSAYREIVRRHPSVFTEFFRVVSDADNLPLVFHCNAGKDRTGILSALLFSVLELPQEDIFKEYLYTNEMIGDVEQSYEEVVRKYVFDYGIFDETTYSKETCQPAIDLMVNWATVKREYLEGIYQEIEENFGGMENFLKERLGVSKELTEHIMSLYLIDFSVERAQEHEHNFGCN